MVRPVPVGGLQDASARRSLAPGDLAGQVHPVQAVAEEQGDVQVAVLAGGDAVRRPPTDISAWPPVVIRYGRLQDTFTVVDQMSVTPRRTRYGWLATVSRPYQGGCRLGTGAMPRLGSGR